MSRREPVHIDLESDQDGPGNKNNLDDAGDSDDERPNRDVDSDGDDEAGEDHNDLGDLDPSLIRAALEREVRSVY